MSDSRRSGPPPADALPASPAWKTRTLCALTSRSWSYSDLARALEAGGIPATPAGISWLFKKGKRSHLVPHIDAVLGTKAVDVIARPPHYTSGPIETIEAIEAWGLGFNLGNVVKYVSRAGKKDPSKTVEDLQKARWYLDREIARLGGAK